MVVGLARQGKALTRYLSEHGADVVVTDLKSSGELSEAMGELSDLPVEYVLGGHPHSLLEGAELLFLSGGVPADAGLAVQARLREIPVSNDAQLFVDECPATVIGITGSAGKTTTTSLVHSIVERALRGTDRKAWLGGNIGRPLIQDLAEMRADDLVVMELSSFQLELMTSSPHIAALLNIMPDHLDRHKTMEAYTAAKARILTNQAGSDIAVLNRDDPGAWSLRGKVRGRLLTFSEDRALVDEGAFTHGGHLWIRFDGDEKSICPVEAIPFRGQHNRMNVLAACAMVAAAKIDLAAIEPALMDFSGVAHRLEFVRRVRGADWYNDSIATTPSRALVAIRSFDEPIILLAGGRDKDLRWDEFAKEILQAVRDLILFGEAAEKIHASVRSHQTEEDQINIHICEGLDQAVEVAADCARAGDVILLSPGATSFDEFPNYEVRGERFMRQVRAL